MLFLLAHITFHKRVLWDFITHTVQSDKNSSKKCFTEKNGRNGGRGINKRAREEGNEFTKTLQAGDKQVHSSELTLYHCL